MQSRPTGGILLTGQLDLFLQNPFGGGKTIAVNWQRLNEESQQLDLAYRHPYLLSSPVTLVLEGNLLKEQEQFLNRSARVALQARQKAGLLLSLEYQFKDTRLLDDARGANLASFRVHKYGIRGEYKKLDNHLLPRQGVVLGAGVLAGPKHISRMADGSTDNLGTNLQLTAALDAQSYWPLAARTVLALKANGALLYDENLFLPDLYRLGGLQSVRGFREKSLFASKYALLQTEIRQQLGNSSYVFLFYDLGLLQYKLPATSYRDWPMGAGAGLSLQAGTGQFSLVYALGHQQNQTISLKNSQVHFGYTSRF
nr:BamA/TamA family outer membrane protein [Cesiribacter sp. SM1]